MQIDTSTPLYLSLDATGATLELVGGKGISLARLVAMRLPVPPGYLLTTTAYRRFVEANDMQAAIMDCVTGITDDDPAALERASVAIQALFEAGTMSDEVTTAIREAYAGLDGSEPTVAVRSSATAR